MFFSGKYLYSQAIYRKCNKNFDVFSTIDRSTVPHSTNNKGERQIVVFACHVSLPNQHKLVAYIFFTLPKKILYTKPLKNFLFFFPSFVQ